MSITDEAEYGQKQINTLELIWGEGFLSPGGIQEIDYVLNNRSIKNLNVLDIGCGCGGAAIHFVKNLEASHVLGVDVEQEVINRANTLKLKSNHKHQLTFQVIEEGPLLFDNESFDMIFSKDAFLHISNKEWLGQELFRLLKPGGFVAASDWMRKDDNPPSEEMLDYIKAEGLDMQMCSLKRYSKSLIDAGFINVKLTDRNEWYLNLAKKEIEDIQVKYKAQLIKILGENDANETVEIWKKMIGVLEIGEHRPGHFMADKPT